jgi:DNA-binding NarL/FixJ family response regulator
VREGLVALLGLLPDIEVVGSAANGEEALRIVAKESSDAILLDLHMPVLDGLCMIAQGKSNPDIAAQLYLSSYTIKSHINRIFAKTRSSDRNAAIRYARDHDLG